MIPFQNSSHEEKMPFSIVKTDFPRGGQKEPLPPGAQASKNTSVSLRLSDKNKNNNNEFLEFHSQ